MERTARPFHGVAHQHSNKQIGSMKHRALAKRFLRHGFVAAIVTALGVASAYAVVESDLSPLVSKSVLISHTDPNKLINVLFALSMTDSQGAAKYALNANTRGHPLYGQYLTPEQFGERFGPSASEYQAILDWAQDEKLNIHEQSKSRTTLTVRGTVAQFEKIFQTTINDYRAADGREFFSAAQGPNLPPEISGKIVGVIGLSSYTKFAPLVRVQKRLEEPAVTGGGATDTAGGTGPGGAYSAADLRAAYGISDSLSIPRKTETFAVFEQGGFFQSDVNVYLTRNKLPSVPVKVRGVNGYNGGVNDPNVELEAVLDIDTAIGINPALKKVVVYEDGDDPFGLALASSLAAIANDDSAQIISISYGTDEGIQGAAQINVEGTLFQQLAAQGQTVFVSAGDKGAYGYLGLGQDGGTFGSYNVSDPGAQPFVTSVGGTSLFTGPKQSYVAEIVWNELASSGFATGGGISVFWTIPSWQTGNGVSTTMRNVPDVAAVGDPFTGFAVYSAVNGGWLQIGGTSLSSPVWASFTSLLDSAQKALQLGRVGFFNPSLYSFAVANHHKENLDSIGINDIYTGTNGDPYLNPPNPPIPPGYSAGQDYDNCTGWGSPFGTLFLVNYLEQPITAGTPPATPLGLYTTATRTTVTVGWNAVPDATGYYAIAEYTPDGGYSFYAVSSDITKGTSAILPGLSPNTIYYIYVGALNTAGGSAQNQVIAQTSK